MGFPVEYVASYATPGVGQRLPLVAPLAGPPARRDRRGRAGRRRLRRHPSLRGPARGAAADGKVVWCRRPLWKAGSSLVPLKRAGAFDAVLEPGELAESLDAGPDRGAARRRAPGRADRPARPRRAAAAGATRRPSWASIPSRTTVLVSLGQGPEVREANRVALARARRTARTSRSRRCRRHSSAPTTVPEGVVGLSATYPMSRYFAAIDACVAAAGYNAFHELIALGVPSLFVPMPRDTDDQPARARWAEPAGLGLGVSGARRPGARGANRRAARAPRARSARTLAIRPEPRGAADAAAWLARARGRGELAGVTSPGTTQAATRGGGAGVPAAVGQLFRSAAADRVAARAPAADQAARAGVGARVRDRG